MPEYKVISRQAPQIGGLGAQGADLNAFQKNVAEHLAEGWTCQGGVSTTLVGSVLYFFQALVRDTTT